MVHEHGLRADGLTVERQPVQVREEPKVSTSCPVIACQQPHENMLPGQDTDVRRPHALPIRSLSLRLAAILLFLLYVHEARAQEEAVKILPIRPLNFDAIVRDQTFSPKERAVELQAGFTALWYRNLEMRAEYRFLDVHNESENLTQHIIFLNPRWNNFIDILDFPAHRPINNLIREALFGPLKHRVVPYVGALGGMVLPGPDNDHPGRFYGGQLGTRFLLTQGISLDLSVEYSRFRSHVHEEQNEARRWLFTIGIRF